MTLLQSHIAKFPDAETLTWDSDHEHAASARQKARSESVEPKAQPCPPARQTPGDAASAAPTRIVRCMDLVLALGLLLFAFPLMVLVALLIKIADPGPVLFVQRRVGKDGIPFKCLKFRSMAIDSEQRLQKLLTTNAVMLQNWTRDQKLANDPRITPVGRFLRVSSLDELPQLWNVVRGEMSLVGPRPIVEAEVPRYGRYIYEYCSVRPGITGLWQVTGRSTTTYRRRVALDVTYARTQSPGLYLKILVRTVPAVAFARGSC